MAELIMKNGAGGIECPNCHGSSFTGCQYDAGKPESYDGVSEWHCDGCGTRFGRWTHRELIAGEIERRYGGR